LVFEHREDDVVFACRFRADVWHYLEDMARERNYNPTKKRFRFGTASSDAIKKSIHTVLDEQLRRLMKE
jgi:hypothetical protein